MNKASLSLALCAAFSLAGVTAATAQKSSSKAPKVEVRAKAPTMVDHFHGCVGVGTSTIGAVPLIGLVAAPVSAVGCGVVWAVPVFVEAFLPKA